MPRAVQAPVPDAIPGQFMARYGVEPHESQQPVRADASEQVSDLGRLASAGGAPVSEMSIGSRVSARTALIVGPNREANFHDGL